MSESLSTDQGSTRRTTTWLVRGGADLGGPSTGDSGTGPIMVGSPMVVLTGSSGRARSALGRCRATADRVLHAIRLRRAGSRTTGVRRPPYPARAARYLAE